jgi:hypothetical protein
MISPLTDKDYVVMNESGLTFATIEDLAKALDEALREY